MKISTKGRYALRMMLEFALHPGECTKISEVAKRQQISDKYLEQIVSILSRAGFVRSVRGAQGGYLLTKKPEEYTVGSILRLTEGCLAPVSCINAGQSSCSRADCCATIDIWKQLDNAISEVVDNITLADIVRNHLNKAKNSGPCDKKEVIE